MGSFLLASSVVMFTVVCMCRAQVLPLNCTGDDDIGGCYVIFSSGAQSAEECQARLLQQFVTTSDPLTFANGDFFAAALVPAVITPDGQCCAENLVHRCTEVAGLFTNTGECSSGVSTMVTQACGPALGSDAGMRRAQLLSACNALIDVANAHATALMSSGCRHTNA